MTAPIPLTVVGGFLGAGKTTLLNHLLRRADRRYGVLVNDFGAINIDAELIAARDGDLVSLTNGCVCCDLGADLGASLNRLAARAPDHVLVEASGVSDPWRIAQLALIEPGFDLQPLVVLADATAIEAQLDDVYLSDTVTRQLRYAELIVLTKTDLAPDAGRVAARLRALRPQARQVQAVDGALAPALLSFPHIPAAASRFSADAGGHDFRSWSWTDSRAFDRDRLRRLLESLPASVLRIKGFCRLDGQAGVQLLQYAAERWAFTPAEARAPALVVIGTAALPEDAELAAMFDGAVAI